MEGSVSSAYIGTDNYAAGRIAGETMAKLRRPFELFAGGKLGSGRQWMSWIHLDDVVAAPTEDATVVVGRRSARPRALPFAACANAPTPSATRKT